VAAADTGSFLFTTAPESAVPGLNELRRRAGDVRLVRWLAPGVGLARTDGATPGQVSTGEAGDDAETGDFAGLAARLRDDPPIFVRHVCPAQIRVGLAGDATDLDRLGAAVDELLLRARRDVGTSVQARLLRVQNAPAYTRFDLHEALARVLGRAGIPLDVRRPGQVVSVVLADGCAYAGISPASDNLSDWAGGERRFAREEGQISRAEFKLTEAVEVFGLQFPAQGSALDLGAAPGGWTRVLRRHGLRVVAVDPADLHPSLADDPGVTHERMTAQQYLRHPGLFDVAVNDMKMDAGASCGLMELVARRLLPSALAVVTLKLPQSRQETLARMAIGKLAAHYRILGARQLFHNRSEVTVALQNRVQ
jgi:23S rRNA (cytidine2498-2'-O)-methyltransferase